MALARGKNPARSLSIDMFQGFSIFFTLLSVGCRCNENIFFKHSCKVGGTFEAGLLGNSANRKIGALK